MKQRINIFKLQVRGFIASGLWAISILGSTIDSTFTALGNRVAGLGE